MIRLFIVLKQKKSNLLLFFISVAIVGRSDNLDKIKVCLLKWRTSGKHIIYVCMFEYINRSPDERIISFIFVSALRLRADGLDASKTGIHSVSVTILTRPRLLLWPRGKEGMRKPIFIQQTGCGTYRVSRTVHRLGQHCSKQFPKVSLRPIKRCASTFKLGLLLSVLYVHPSFSNSLPSIPPPLSLSLSSLLVLPLWRNS